MWSVFDYRKHSIKGVLDTVSFHFFRICSDMISGQEKIIITGDNNVSLPPWRKIGFPATALSGKKVVPFFLSSEAKTSAFPLRFPPHFWVLELLVQSHCEKLSIVLRCWPGPKFQGGKTQQLRGAKTKGRRWKKNAFFWKKKVFKARIELTATEWQVL